jgi:acyl-coenzyme A synthetase/AMP-(fatty) acid ligase
MAETDGSGLVAFTPPEHLRGAPPPPGVVDLPDEYNVAGDLIDAGAARHGDACALVDASDRREVTYAGLADGTARASTVLADLGAVREGRVAVIADDSPEWIMATFGAMRAGMVAVPLSTLLPSEAIEAALELTRPQVVVVDAPRHEMVASLLPDSAPIVSIDDTGPDGWRHRMGSADPAAPAATRADEPALILFTSGTTGQQKGAVHAQRDLANGRCFADLMGYDTTDRLWATSKLFFSFAIGSTLSAGLSAGASIVLNRGPVTPERIVEVVGQTRPTVISSVPSLFARLVHGEYDPEPFASLRHAVSAGEALPPEIAARVHRRFGVEILEHLGSTEFVFPFTATPPGRSRAGSVGPVMPGVEAMILNGDRLAEIGEPGDLWISGPSVMDGYLHNRAATRRALVHGWLRVGDVVQSDADGYLTVRGRSDDLFMSSGIKVSPVEIEIQLAEHEAVSEVAVVGGPTADGLTRPWAFVVPADGARTDGLDDELRTWVRERLPKHEAPRQIVLIDELPRTVTGKVRRFRLVETAREILDHTKET